MLAKGNTYHRLDFHVVFSTKNRLPLLGPAILERLRQLFIEKAEALGVIVHVANGYDDHIHLLLSIPPRLSIAEVLKHLKGFSSRRIEDLYWQEGYSAFTVDATSFDKTFQYIKNQLEHHRDMAYDDEIHILIKDNGLWEARKNA